MKKGWILALLLVGCAHAPPVPPRAERPAGSLVTAGGEPTTVEAIATGTTEARFILVGEAHDKRCDHQVQAALIAALAAAGRPPLVGLEMVDIDRQPILDRFAAGEIPVSGLGDALGWQENWGIAYELYEPIFVEARRWQLPVVALNLPRELVRAVSREGVEGLPAADRERLPRILPPPPEQERMLRESFEAHAGAISTPMGESGFHRFMLVQSLWDSQMAESALSWSERLHRDPVVILAGGGHVVHGWGIGSRLRTLDPAATFVGILPWRGEAPIDPAEGALFFYCP